MIKRMSIVCHLLLGWKILFCQQSFVLERSLIPLSEKEYVVSQMKQIKEYASQIYIYEVNNSLKRHISYFRCPELKEYLKRIIINDEQIEKITVNDSILSIYYKSDFYQFQIMDAIYYMYNDIYASFFSYGEIKGIKILLIDETNLTFLPTINSDSWIPVENALMKKEWFIPDIDYVSFLGVENVESGHYLNDKGEYKVEIIDAKIKEYQNLINCESKGKLD